MTPAIEVRPVGPGDRDPWVAMRTQLWPEAPDDHPREVDAFFEGQPRLPEAALIARAGAEAVGFVELSIRPYADGCATDRVGYVEGWYVEPAWRRSGVGRALIEAAERWARQQGCTEMASDADLGNETSRTAHLALGFEEVERVILFRKGLA